MLVRYVYTYEYRPSTCTRTRTRMCMSNDHGVDSAVGSLT